MLSDWRKAGGLGAALKWFEVMSSDLMGKDDQGTAFVSRSDQATSLTRGSTLSGIISRTEPAETRASCIFRWVRA